ncbi:peptide chain release factor N(5)-glutamine methyltransferase [Aeromicrobium sp. CTD01-1L150]|uniref:peptide chain release factor N(5)-glutamine methyltransferase n=1 Tax=Aeromicrobium sp. CTD01-1L150 TaxID=3341830 RepID=UPI0035C1A6A6
MTRVRSRAERLLQTATEQLEAAGVPSPGVDAELLLSHVMGVPRGLLRSGAHPQEMQRRTYLEMVQARARRVPLQHITGTAAFRYVDLEVGPGVFVPRPETELLAGWAIDQALLFSAQGPEPLPGVVSARSPEPPPGQREQPVVVDLCTGSGAIALSLVHEVPGARVHAVELDEKAHGWAEQNLIGTGVDLRLGDAFDAFEDLDGTVDVVVCNPPYIPLEAWESVAPEARDHDPSLALWSGDDGLDAMRRLEKAAWRLLRPGGVVAAEHADAQGTSAPAVFAARWSEVRDHTDLADRPRFVTATRP